MNDIGGVGVDAEELIVGAVLSGEMQAWGYRRGGGEGEVRLSERLSEGRHGGLGIPKGGADARAHRWGRSGGENAGLGISEGEEEM